MIRSLRDSKAHLSELVERASQGEEILITVNGKVRAKLVGVAVPDSVQDVMAWRKELSALNRKHLRQGKDTPMAKILDDVREDRF